MHEASEKDGSNRLSDNNPVLNVKLRKQKEMKVA
jgi:hypothetical protein